MKRAFKKIIIIVLLFIISFFCVRHWFTIQSENLWTSTKESLISKGVSFNLKDIIPPKVLDRENFALADFFRAENEEFIKKPSFKNDVQKLVFEYDKLPSFIDLKILQQSFRDEGLDIWNQPEVQGKHLMMSRRQLKNLTMIFYYSNKPFKKDPNIIPI